MQEEKKEECNCGIGTDKYEIWGSCPIKNHQIPKPKFTNVEERIREMEPYD